MYVASESAPCCQSCLRVATAIVSILDSDGVGVTSRQMRLTDLELCLRPECSRAIAAGGTSAGASSHRAQRETALITGVHDAMPGCWREEALVPR